MSDPRATLAQLVADTLRDSLREGRYRSGERMIELAIAQSQDVSQNTVRDALRQLESEGWVRYEARRGVRVRRFDADEAEEIFALMGTLESLALGWAFDGLSRAGLLSALKPPLEMARQAHDAGQVLARRNGLFAFHAALSALSGRAQTREILAVLHNQAYLLTADYELRPDSTTHHDEQMAAYEHLLGVLKFGTLPEVQGALGARILADAKPIIRWLAMHG